MIARLFFVLLLTCWITGPGLAQERRLAGRVDSLTRAEVQRVVESAQRDGLPVEPLLDKALEGAAKRANGPRIVMAVRSLAEGLRASKAALGSSTAEPDLVAGAEALRVGAGQQSLAELRAARRDQSLLVPLAALSDLISRGVPADTAAAAVLRLAERGASDAEFDALERAVEQDISTGASPATAASVRASAGSDSPEHAGGTRASNDRGEPANGGNGTDGIGGGGGAGGQGHGGQNGAGPGVAGTGDQAGPPAGDHPPKAHGPKDKPPKGKDRPPKAKPPKNKPQPAQPPKEK